MLRCSFALLQETAFNIAYSCQLISFDQFAVIVIELSF